MTSFPLPTRLPANICRGMVAKPIGGQTAFDQVEAGVAAGNKIDDPRPNNRPDHLGNDVRDHLRGGKTSPNTQANGDRGFKWQPER